MPKSAYSRFSTSTIAQKTRTHTVIGAEDIPAIAAFEYNTGYDAELWRQVAEYNDIDDLDDLSAGMVLTIPQATVI